MPRVIIQSTCHVSEKGDSACHLSESAQSAGLGGYSKTKKIY